MEYSENSQFTVTVMSRAVLFFASLFLLSVPRAVISANNLSTTCDCTNVDVEDYLRSSSGEDVFKINRFAGLDCSSVPFGELPSDWSRLLLLRDAQPKGSVLKNKLERLFRILLIAHLSKEIDYGQTTQHAFSSAYEEEGTKDSITTTRDVEVSEDTTMEVSGVSEEGVEVSENISSELINVVPATNYELLSTENETLLTSTPSQTDVQTTSIVTETELLPAKLTTVEEDRLQTEEISNPWKTLYRALSNSPEENSENPFTESLPNDSSSTISKINVDDLHDRGDLPLPLDEDGIIYYKAPSGNDGLLSAEQSFHSQESDTEAPDANMNSSGHMNSMSPSIGHRVTDSTIINQSENFSEFLWSTQSTADFNINVNSNQGSEATSFLFTSFENEVTTFSTTAVTDSTEGTDLSNSEGTSSVHITDSILTLPILSSTLTDAYTTQETGEDNERTSIAAYENTARIEKGSTEKVSSTTRNLPNDISDYKLITPDLWLKNVYRIHKVESESLEKLSDETLEIVSRPCVGHKINRPPYSKQLPPMNMVQKYITKIFPRKLSTPYVTSRSSAEQRIDSKEYPLNVLKSRKRGSFNNDVEEHYRLFYSLGRNNKEVIGQPVIADGGSVKIACKTEK